MCVCVSLQKMIEFLLRSTVCHCPPLNHLFVYIIYVQPVFLALFFFSLEIRIVNNLCSPFCPFPHPL